MTCDRSQSLSWSAWQDGELPPAEARAWQEHVGDCPDCRAASQRARQLSQMLKSAALCEPERESVQGWARAARRRIEARRLHQLTQSLTAAAAVLLVACLFSLSAERSHTDAPLAEIESLHLTPIALRGDEPAPQSLIVAEWLAADLGLDGSTGVRP